MDIGKVALQGLRDAVNGCLRNKEPWQIVTITASGVIAGYWLWENSFQIERLLSRGKNIIFKLAVPSRLQEINKEIARSFEIDVMKRIKGVPYITSLPQRGKKDEEILQMVEEHLSLGEYKWKEGFVSGGIYHYDPSLIKLLTEVYGRASYTNLLHSSVFPGLCKLEAEVVRISAELFQGGPHSCGSLTSGGTESIFLACRAYRNYARESGIKHPEMVMPKTAHPAFDKAAEYLGMHIKYVSIDPTTKKVDLKKMERAINKNSCMLIGSAPNYPYGIIDDLEGIAALGHKYNIPVHVDACLGGFILVFMKRCGYSVPPFDFSIPGITSISADMHKYGNSPKGSSVVLYSDTKYINHQFFSVPNWPGGLYSSPTVNGSRSGGIIAACWATFMYFGLDGYIEITKKIVETTKYIERGLRQIKGIYVFGSPNVSVIAIGSNDFHIYRLFEALSKSGWYLGPLQFPSGLHLSVTHMHTSNGVADRFLRDVKKHVDVILQNPKQEVEGKLALYAASHTISDRSAVDDVLRSYCHSLYFTPKRS